MKWKKEDKLLEDPEGIKLWIMFCQGIKERNDELFSQLTKEIVLDGDDLSVWDRVTELSGNKMAINRGAEGEKSDLMHDVIKYIAEMTT